MKSRLGIRGGIALLLSLALLLAGCDGEDKVSIVQAPTATATTVPAGQIVSGLVELPVAQEAGVASLLQRLAATIVATAEALIGVAPAPDVLVTAVLVTDTALDVTELPPVGIDVTDASGMYEVNVDDLPIGSCTGADERLVVFTQEGGLTRALVFAETGVDIDANSEALVRLLVEQIDGEGDRSLCDVSGDEIANLLALIDAATAEVSGATVDEINANAFAAAAEDPAVIAAIEAAFAEEPTPTPTNTSSPTETPERTASPTNTEAVETATPVEVTLTPEPTETPIVVVPTFTRTSTLVPTATATATATQTETPTEGPAPEIDIGTATGMPGETVTIDIDLANNGFNIIFISPLQLTFDNVALTFETCTTPVAGKSVLASLPQPNLLSIGLTGSLDVLPDGTVLQCSFVIGAGTAPGTYPLVFVQGGTTDGENDIPARGTDGAVIVPGGDTPTPEPTVTATVAPVGPAVAIGSDCGDQGQGVSIDIDLNKNGFNIIFISPLQFQFNSEVLAFGTCTTPVAGKSVLATTPSPGLASIALTGSLDVLPDGTVLTCTFTISETAADGIYPLTFVQAGMTDGENDIDGQGTSGSVAVPCMVSPTDTPPPPPTATAVPATATQTSAPATATPTSVAATATRTATAVPASPTRTLTTAPTITATPMGEVPSVAVGSDSGQPGEMVTIPFTLDKKGQNIIFISPLQVTFNNTVLTFGSCTTPVSGKSVLATTPTPGLLSIAITGSLDVLPDGVILNCTFTIGAGAAAGNYPLVFQQAGMTDGENDIEGAGTDGNVNVGGAMPTATEVPATATQVPPTATGVPATATAVPPTATAVPPTATVIPPTATATTGPSGPSIAVGSVTGSAGAMVTLPFTLSSAGVGIIFVSPLQIMFDTAVLSFGSCSSPVAGKSVLATTPTPGLLSIAITGSLDILPDAVILNCTFTIAGGASPGTTTLTFVQAGLTDGENDIEGSGTNGSVTVQ